MLAVALALAIVGPSSAFDYACPGELAPSAISVPQPPSGWIGFIPTKIFLNGVGISTGPLENRATLIGDYRKLRRGAFSVAFSLKGLERYDRWILCQYGLGNEIVIAKQLREPVAQCVVTYTPDKFGGKTIKVACH
jgi:hypothetical protein